MDSLSAESGLISVSSISADELSDWQSDTNSNTQIQFALQQDEALLPQSNISSDAANLLEGKVLIMSIVNICILLYFKYDYIVVLLNCQVLRI